MATLTIRNLPEPVHDALRRRAAENRRSMEAEARAVLSTSLQMAPPPPPDQDLLRRAQRRAIAAFGGEEAKVGAVDRFLAERASDWDE
jgi:plasmid stability protein